MTDVLAERFGALTDHAAGDWLDVRRQARAPTSRADAGRRRSRGRSRCSCVCRGWMVVLDGNVVRARTPLQFHGQTYAVAADVAVGGRELILALERNNKYIAYGNGNYVLEHPACRQSRRWRT